MQALNPMVSVTVDTSDLNSKEESFFKDFDVVVVASYPKDVKVRVNEMCRKTGANFYCGDVFGFFGYSFMDLIEHKYLEETTVKVRSLSLKLKILPCLKDFRLIIIAAACGKGV